MLINHARQRATCAVALLFFGTAATAQTLTDAERSARVTLLSRASEARRGGHPEEALALVQQAERIGATAGTRMFDSQLRAQLRQFAGAHASAEQCLREVDLDAQTSTANRQAIRAACEAVRTEALGHVGRLIVRVPAGAPEGLRVEVNGQLLRSPLYGIEQLMDVGAVSVTATLSGASPWERRETVAAGTTVSLDVVVPPLNPTVAPVNPITQAVAVPPSNPPASVVVAPTPPVALPAVPERGRAPGATQRLLAYTSVATGLALLAGAGVASIVFQGTTSDFSNEQCSDPPNCTSLLDRLGTLNTLQAVGYIGGGVLALTGVVLLVTAPSRPPSHRTLSCGAGPGLMGIACGARF